VHSPSKVDLTLSASAYSGSEGKSHRSSSPTAVLLLSSSSSPIKKSSSYSSILDHSSHSNRSSTHNNSSGRGSPTLQTVNSLHKDIDLVENNDHNICEKVIQSIFRFFPEKHHLIVKKVLS
jgi:hypothetical protein